MVIRDISNIPKRDVNKIIDKAGSDSFVREEDKKSKWPIHLKIPSSLLQEVDEAVSKRVVLTRTAWILEAIQQKLKRDRDEY